MFAIVELGGKQYIVKEKDTLRIEKLPVSEGEATSSNKVLLLSNGSSVTIGTPYVSGASVDLKVKKNGRDQKVVIFKMKAKKRYKRLRGHRQPFSEVEVVKIKA